ncbi:hypothetical protein C1I99_05695 [Micromonospora deserti]|uniref:Low temperature requirement protein A n=1 Tax=Micromonospora deserti TaxID=2070366 RepID=A0A2W2DX20_9ACTN|nr:hypothetical protein C1I99_05695 [Micromonospora deserti]
MVVQVVVAGPDRTQEWEEQRTIRGGDGFLDSVATASRHTRVICGLGVCAWSARVGRNNRAVAEDDRPQPIMLRLLRGRPPAGKRPAAPLREQGGARQANFLELFFDLVLVFALFGVVSRIVSGMVGDSAVERWGSLVYVLVLALPLIWLWTTTAHITSRFDPRLPVVQVMVLSSAFGLVIMTTSLPFAFTARGIAFALPYVLLQVGRPLVLVILLRDHPLRVVYARSMIWFAASAVPWLAGTLVMGGPRVVLWALAVTMEYGSARRGWPVPGLGRRPASAWAVGTGHHLADRYQQFLLIALGESVLSVGTKYTAGPTNGPTTLALVVASTSCCGGSTSTALGRCSPRLWRQPETGRGQAEPSGLRTC